MMERYVDEMVRISRKTTVLWLLVWAV